jgi:hypothetical protein
MSAERHRLCACKALRIKWMRGRKIPVKFARNAVDLSFIYRYVDDPAESGTPLIWSAFYVHFGTANWLNFVPT